MLDESFFNNPSLDEVVAETKRSSRSVASISHYLNNKFKGSKLHTIIMQQYGDSLQEKIFCYVNSLSAAPNCVCGSKLSFLTFSKGYANWCGPKCASNNISVIEKTKKTRLERYGTPDLSKVNTEKIIKSKLERFGVEHQMKNKDVATRQQSSYTNNHGGIGFASSAVNCKIESTMIERYGSPRNWQSEQLVEKYRRERLERTIRRYKDTYTNFEIQIDDTEYLGNHKFIDMQCVDCGTFIHKNFLHGGPSCVKCQGLMHRSKPEDELFEFCRSLLPNEKVLSSYRIFGGSDQRSVDVYIPHLNLAFEFNGLYWHSTKFKDPLYHQVKSDDAAAIGIRIIHIFEDDFTLKLDIVKSMISNALGKSEKVYARTTKLNSISPKIAREFLDENHLQGFISGKYYVGLFRGNELISVMVVSKTRFSKTHTWELGRWATKRGLVCIGGFSKCLTHVKKLINGEPILTYCDASHSNGSVYEKFGTLLYKTQPNYFYFSNKEWWRHNRVKYQKHKLVNLSNFSNEKTEKQIMQENGWMVIYDCGNLVYEL